MSKTTDEVKKKIILSILNTYAKTGAYLGQINKSYEGETGEKMAPTKVEGEAYMSSLEEVYLDPSGRYWSHSEKSKHINKMVAEQNTKFSPNYLGQKRAIWQNFNASSNSRSFVSYQSDYADVNFPSTSTGAAAGPGKIRKRRQTCGPGTTPFNVQSSSSEAEHNKRRCATPDRERAPKRARSRSRSPSFRRDRETITSRSRARSRSPSKRSWRPISPAYSPPRVRRSRSPVRERRSPARERRSPARDRRSPARDPRSPFRNRRSMSPRNKRSVSPGGKRPRHHGSRSPPRWSDANARSTTNGAENTETRNTESTSVFDQINGKKLEAKSKKFKFTIIGDGNMYYMLSDMQSDVKVNLSLCNHTLTMANALDMIKVQQKTLQMKKRKVMVSIGVTDLRNGRTLHEMKRDFTALFLLCDQYGLKPLITTIVCFDTPELNRKASVFNNFLLESFENVIDMRVVLRSGLADVMTALNKKHAMKLNHNSLGLGTRQQLILNVPKE